jgi:hypothetical protein
VFQCYVGGFAECVRSQDVALKFTERNPYTWCTILLCNLVPTCRLSDACDNNLDILLEDCGPSSKPVPSWRLPLSIGIHAVTPRDIGRNCVGIDGLGLTIIAFQCLLSAYVLKVLRVKCKANSPATRHGGAWGERSIAPTYSWPRH